MQWDNIYTVYVSFLFFDNYVEIIIFKVNQKLNMFSLFHTLLVMYLMIIINIIDIGHFSYKIDIVKKHAQILISFNIKCVL